ncbi:MAG: hypothetical protein RSG77_20885 [Hafnia sp.]
MDNYGFEITNSDNPQSRIESEQLVWVAKGTKIGKHDAKSVKSSAVYSDRLLDQDRSRHDLLCQRHWGNKSQWWTDRSPKSIEAFLIDWLATPFVTLTRITKGTNASNGFPYWVFFFDYLDIEQMANDLDQEATAKGAESDALDELVYEQAAEGSMPTVNAQLEHDEIEASLSKGEEFASQVNNEGRVAQISFLLKANVSAESIRKALEI